MATRSSPAPGLSHSVPSKQFHITDKVKRGKHIKLHHECNFAITVPVKALEPTFALF